MYKQLLVPLDGSVYAAAALSHASALARSSGGKVLLIRVIHTSDEWLMRSITPDSEIAETSQDVLASRRHDEEKLESQAYLEERKQILEAEGLAVEIAVREGQPAEEILREAFTRQVDLIILTAYGHGGAHVLKENAVFGSVADSVLRESRVPVLVIKPHA